MSFTDFSASAFVVMREALRFEHSAIFASIIFALSAAAAAFFFVSSAISFSTEASDFSTSSTLPCAFLRSLRAAATVSSATSKPRSALSAAAFASSRAAFAFLTGSLASALTSAASEDLTFSSAAVTAAFASAAAFWAAVNFSAAVLRAASAAAIFLSRASILELMEAFPSVFAVARERWRLAFSSFKLTSVLSAAVTAFEASLTASSVLPTFLTATLRLSFAAFTCCFAASTVICAFIGNAMKMATISAARILPLPEMALRVLRLVEA